MVDLVHALSDADRRSEVIHGVDTGQRSPDGKAIPHVSFDELHFLAEVWRTRRAGPVDLRREIVERAHAVAASEELIGYV
jgi:hypothetical protein